MLLSLAAGLYILGVQLPTIAINLPLNNKLQRLDVDAMPETDLKAVRGEFEPRWNTSNRFRTVIACGSSALFMLLLFRL